MESKMQQITNDDRRNRPGLLRIACLFLEHTVVSMHNSDTIRYTRCIRKRDATFGRHCEMHLSFHLQ